MKYPAGGHSYKARGKGQEARGNRGNYGLINLSHSAGERGVSEAAYFGPKAQEGGGAKIRHRAQPRGRSERSPSDMPFPCFEFLICEHDTKYFHGK